MMRAVIFAKRFTSNRNQAGWTDGLLPVIESNEAALVLASYGRYRSGDASSGITLFIFVN